MVWKKRELYAPFTGLEEKILRIKGKIKFKYEKRQRVE
jgi:hypothetical protein